MPYPERLRAAATEYKHAKGSMESRKSGPGLRPIAAAYNIDPASLNRHLQGKMDITAFNQGKCKLRADEEATLEEIVLESAARGFPVNLDMIKDLALAIGRVRDPSLTLGEKWAGSFVERREKLRMHWTKKLSKVCSPLVNIFTCIF